MNYAARVVRKAVNTVNNLIEDRKVAKLFRGRPVYHVHVRKTAGTSINLSFFSNYTNEDPDAFYQQLVKKNNSRLISGDDIIVGWDQSRISQGEFNYAFSHIPLHQLNLDSSVFKFTCLRDPVKRFVSHYNMLMYYKNHEPEHPVLRGEGQWLGSSFDDFLNNVPTHHLKNQLHMFSSKLDHLEATDTVMQLDHVMFTESLATDLKELETKLSVQLPLLRSKSYGFKADISEDSLDHLREILDDEYTFIDEVKSRLV